jgi:phosphoserine phosphatase
MSSGASNVAAARVPHASVVSSLRSAQAVCFDVDSTVITVEAIDEFAAFAGKKQEVAALTAKAMGGSVPFHEALEARLGIIQPTQTLLDRFLLAHPFQFAPGVRDVIARLQSRGTPVYLVSGGFTQMINPVADALSIPRSRVYANTILFDGAGRYAGFDRSAPTSRDGGKAVVMQKLKAEHAYAPLVMVGDGATDLQARPPADVMLGYGGIVVREVVASKSDWFVRDFSLVAKVLDAHTNDAAVALVHEHHAQK